jgi:hypothetical protein
MKMATSQRMKTFVTALTGMGHDSITLSLCTQLKSTLDTAEKIKDVDNVFFLFTLLLLDSEKLNL